MKSLSRWKVPLLQEGGPSRIQCFAKCPITLIFVRLPQFAGRLIGSTTTLQSADRISRDGDLQQLVLDAVEDALFHDSFDGQTGE